MSIFPKRTIPGSTVTIHWNFNTAHLKDIAVCPFVRIGVIDPQGKITMLAEKHFLALPAIQPSSTGTDQQLQYLNKNLPLLVMADYLSGMHKKEVLVDILQNIQSGKHYYFTYPVPDNAILGKYTLLSEVYSGGACRLSKTAPDDFFYVEKLSVTPGSKTEAGYYAEIVNHSPEKTPVKIVDYKPGNLITPGCLQVFELKEFEKRTVRVQYPHSYLSYNEEREMLPLTYTLADPPCIRNQQLLELNKHNSNEIFLLSRDSDHTYKLTGIEAGIWLLADGVHRRSDIRTKDCADAYDSMMASGLIRELN